MNEAPQRPAGRIALAAALVATLAACATGAPVPDPAQPPAPPQSANYAVVGGNTETRNKLKSTRGSIAPLSTGFIDGHSDLVAVPLDGIAPTMANVASGKYPMTRPLYMITNGQPKGATKQYIDYILSAEGQKLLPKHGYLTRQQMGL